MIVSRSEMLVLGLYLYSYLAIDVRLQWLLYKTECEEFVVHAFSMTRLNVVIVDNLMPCV